jgi:cyclopropane fatty-acyl-phospholipid synthase-like methyltransferase
MAVRVDPEGNELRTLLSLADPAGLHVLEIGCGDGRLTWSYAARATAVTAVDPWEGGIARASQRLPEELAGRVEFRHAGFLDFAAAKEASTFDMAILSWSL